MGTKKKAAKDEGLDHLRNHFILSTNANSRNKVKMAITAPDTHVIVMD
jgi:hypothetical protein